MAKSKVSPQKFKKVLIANRSEIAVRVSATLKQMGIKSVAVYSHHDKSSLHSSVADEAYLLTGETTLETYLNQEQIIQIAKQAQVDAIHPGYGFLSENPEFAKRCEKENIKLIGPSAQIMQSMGDKICAKETAQKAGVPVVPGYQADASKLDDNRLKKIAQEVGFPILVKATAGGGGKGMRLVQDESQLKSAIELASSEAQKAFGNGQVFLEKYLINPRHIEVQVLGDQHSNVVHCGIRDCSIQRRHQKVIEEAGQINLAPQFIEAICNSAVDLAKAVQYENAGTVEFIVNEAGTEFYFLEMNTRLQVEHPVTEWVYGLDLVKHQIQIAQGHPLLVSQEQLIPKGHSIECRLYAEDPDNNYFPQTGTLALWQWPTHIPYTRLDSGFREGDSVTIFYDPMLAKISVWGETREDAIEKMVSTLKQFAVLGVKTNQQFCLKILNHPDFINGKTHTHWLNNIELNHTDALSIDEKCLLVLAEQNAGLNLTTTNSNQSLIAQPSSWRFFS